MKKISSVQRYQTEKAIIDALLKISEIIKKTTNINSYSKKTTGDGDKQQRHIPIPPPMRTLESYVSGFNQQSAISSSSQRPLNSNRAPIVVWNSRSHSKLYSLRRKHRNQERHRYDVSTSSISNDHYRKKHKSSGSDKRRRIRCECQSRYDDNEYSASDC
jgi:hypothetical protein